MRLIRKLLLLFIKAIVTEVFGIANYCSFFVNPSLYFNEIGDKRWNGAF